MKRNIGEEDEEESKPKREFIPLDFGDDAAGQGVSTIDPMLQRQLQQIEDDDDDEDLDDKDGGAFKKNMNKKKNMQQMSAAAARYTATPICQVSSNALTIISACAQHDSGHCASESSRPGASNICCTGIGQANFLRPYGPSCGGSSAGQEGAAEKIGGQHPDQ